MTSADADVDADCDEGTTTCGGGGTKRIKVNHTYRDFSNDSLEAVRLQLGVSPDQVARAMVRTRHPYDSCSRFPIKLYDIVTNPEYQHIIRFMPHGRSWIVIDKQALASQVLPKYFNQSNFQSFSRQVNGWGFTRLCKEGRDHKSYYHELFIRGRTDLMTLMIRLVSPGRRVKLDIDHEPDFYSISEKNPLPKIDPKKHGVISQGLPQRSEGSVNNEPPRLDCAATATHPHQLLEAFKRYQSLSNSQRLEDSVNDKPLRLDRAAAHPHQEIEEFKRYQVLSQRSGSVNNYNEPPHLDRAASATLPHRTIEAFNRYGDLSQLAQESIRQRVSALSACLDKTATATLPHQAMEAFKKYRESSKRAEALHGQQVSALNISNRLQGNQYLLPFMGSCTPTAGHIDRDAAKRVPLVTTVQKTSAPSCSLQSLPPSQIDTTILPSSLSMCGNLHQPAIAQHRSPVFTFEGINVQINMNAFLSFAGTVTTILASICHNLVAREIERRCILNIASAIAILVKAKTKRKEPPSVVIGGAAKKIRTRTICSNEGCNKDQQGGICYRHCGEGCTINTKTCSLRGCTKGAVKGLASGADQSRAAVPLSPKIQASTQNMAHGENRDRSSNNASLDMGVIVDDVCNGRLDMDTTVSVACRDADEGKDGCGTIQCKEIEQHQGSGGYNSEEEEELGALIYRSSATGAKR